MSSRPTLVGGVETSEVRPDAAHDVLCIQLAVLVRQLHELLLLSAHIHAFCVLTNLQ